MECSNCGVSGKVTRLFDVISGDGIVRLCESCLSADSVPLKRPTGLAPGEEKKQTTYERLSGMAGLNPEEHRQNIFENVKKEELKKQEVTLRDLVDKKFDKFVKEEIKKRDDLVENFHWIIMRARRAKKISISQLAKEIHEAEKVVKLAEQGILPEGYDVITKLEAVLGISILKPEVRGLLQRQPKRLTFDRMKAKTVTISDLQEIKDEEIDLSEQSKKEVPYWRKFMSRLINKREKNENEIVFQEVGEAKIEKEEPEVVREEVAVADFDDKADESVQYDDTSLQMTTRFSGEEEAEEKEDKIDAVDNQEKEKEDELSQKEIDDLIFGRKE
jgi:ribosome-binding protein aMBF1 (putative translation factor)